MAKARTKVISKTSAGNIVRLRDGRFRLDCKDSWGKRHRPAFATREEAVAQLERIAVTKDRGEFLAASKATTFNTALDLLEKRNERVGLAESSRRRITNVINAHLRPTFGNKKLSDFPARRCAFVQEWLDRRAEDHGAAAMTLTHALSYIKMALDEAIKAGHLGSPNPITEFKVSVPQINRRAEREVLTLDEISKLISAASRRDHGEHEAASRVRFMLVLFGMLLGLRDQECGGLCWDCINFDDRTIHVRRIVRDGKLVADTKTGKKGFRAIPMSPILYVALAEYRDWLKAQGYEVEGAVPVLVPGRADLVTQNAVGDHWDRLAKKAGFIDATWAKNHTFYALRHTCLNLWRTINIPIDRLSTLAGHTNILTTHSRYLHETPHFEIIRSEVHALGLEQTPAGSIDGLGIVLARRWREDGIEIPCAPPRSATPPLLENGSAPLLLTGNVIDVVPTEAWAERSATATNVNSLQALRAHQMKRCHELHAQGWTKNRIGKELGLCRSTISDWIRTTPDVRWMRKAGRAERAEKMAQCAQLRDEHPDWSTTQIAAELGIAPHRIVMWERKRGKPMPRRPGAHKIGRYKSDLWQMLGEDKTTEQMAAELNRKYPNRKTPSHSGIAYFIIRMGWRKGPPGARKLGKHQDRILQMKAEGKSPEQMARELDGVSVSGIRGFLKRLSLQTQTAGRQETIA